MDYPDSSKSEEKDFVDKPDGVDCRSDRECRIGFECSKSLGRCVKVGNVKFGGECEEKAGGQMIVLINVKSILKTSA